MILGRKDIIAYSKNKEKRADLKTNMSQSIDEKHIMARSTVYWNAVCLLAFYKLWVVSNSDFPGEFNVGYDDWVNPVCLYFINVIWKGEWKTEF
jgi:hypothetical protein